MDVLARVVGQGESINSWFVVSLWYEVNVCMYVLFGNCE